MMEAKLPHSQIRFRAQCATKFGEILAISGSISQLGEWDPKKAVRMQWDENNWWKVELPNPQVTFEYKYILLHDHDPTYVYYEPGMNRTFNPQQHCSTEKTVIVVDVWGKREDFIAHNHHKHEIRIMTFNIRFDNPKDGNFVWKNRVDKVASMIRIHRPEIIGMQESLINQIKDLEKLLGERYKWIGWGRNDGKSSGEFCPIVYRSDLFTAKECGMFWLSETPEVPGSKSWGSSLPRICTWAKFHRNATEYLQRGKDFFVFNTHLDHISSKARQEGFKLIVSKMASMFDGCPSILMGDFNAEITSSEIADIIEKPNPWGIMLVDAKKASKWPPHGPSHTFIVLDYAVLSDVWDNNFPPSDHRPVIIDIEI